MARQFGYWFAQGIAHFESNSSGGIILAAEQDSGGVWTGPNGIITNPDGSPVREGQTWSLMEAVALYAEEKQEFADHIERELGDLNPKVSQIMFDGLGLLCWNIGRGAFSRSTVLRELRAGNIEDAAAAFLKWRGDTMHGGEPGPDGKPVRGPDGVELPKGVAWFKLFRGLYRRSMYGALLFMKRDPSFAADAGNIQLGKLTTTRPDSEYYYYDVMIEEQSTSWRDALDASGPAEKLSPAYTIEAKPASWRDALDASGPAEKLSPAYTIEAKPASWRDALDASGPAEKLSPAYTIEAKPAPKLRRELPELPSNWETMTPKQQTAWLNGDELKALVQKGSDPVSPQVTPVKKVRPVKQVRPASEVPYLSEEAKANPKTKKVGQSKRGNGFANKKIGGVLGGATVAGMAADQIGAVEPVLKAANTYGTQVVGWVLLGGLGLAAIAYVWGLYLQRWGEEDADTYLE